MVNMNILLTKKFMMTLSALRLVIAASWIFLLVKNKKDKKWNDNADIIKDKKTESKKDSETEIIEC